MQSIKQMFRSTYDGEQIVVSSAYSAGTWTYEYENMPKTIHNTRFGNNALVIGNGIDRLTFDLSAVKRQQAAFSTAKKILQTYGCNALYRDFDPDYLVITGDDIAAEIASTGYCTTHVVYANAVNINKHATKFHMIPQDPTWNSGAIAAYMACFDGHSRVYLMGFDGNDTVGASNNVYANTNAYKSDSEDHNDAFWSTAMNHVFRTYPVVDFVLVNSSGRGYMPEAWKSYTNLRRIDYRQMTLECDL